MEKHDCNCFNHRTPVTGKYECLAFVRGNVAYALDALPQTHVEITTGTPWAQSAIHLCGTHHTQFINRKPISIISKEETMNINQTIPTYGPEMDDINAPFMTAGEIRLYNEIKENNMPKSYPAIEGDFDKHQGYALCSKCTAEIGSNWYHPVKEIRTCMGVAPEQSNRRGSFVKDSESGVVTNERTGDLFIFDSSKSHVIRCMQQLRAEGYLIKKVAKSAKTGEWFVCYAPKS
jgi:hypothetical protein